MELFSFPFYLFYFLSLVSFWIGVSLLSIGIKSAQNKLKFYRFGTLKDAFLLVVQPIVARGKNNFQPYLMVDYYYKDTLGQKVNKIVALNHSPPLKNNLEVK